MKNYKKKFINDNENQNKSQTMLEEMTDEEEFFKDFSTQEIEEKDPSLNDNYIKMYQEEIPFELRIEDEEPPNDSIFLKLLFKILINVKNNVAKIEITYDKDLFFYYITEIDINIFNKLKESQKLKKNFNNFPDLVGNYLDLCMNEPEKYLGVLNILKDKNAKLEIFENLNYKFAEILILNFIKCTDQFEIRKQIIYRYISLKNMYNVAKKKAISINKVLKETEPDLIPKIKEEVSKVKIDTAIRIQPLFKDS